MVPGDLCVSLWRPSFTCEEEGLSGDNLLSLGSSGPLIACIRYRRSLLEEVARISEAPGLAG